jgi:gliding motility-associated-like protein
MKKKLLYLLFTFLSLPTASFAQSISAAMAYYVNEKGESRESREINDGDAPLEVTFRANPTEIEDIQPTYEWHFRKANPNGGNEEFLVRYEEDTQYTFSESGTFNIVLKASYVDGNDIVELDSVNFMVVISASKLEFPNAFSPNGDEKNDIYMAKKDGYKNIVEFHAYIFNRWGQKLFDWTDVTKGWDGTYNGHPVKEGVYFVLVKAKGADGKVYNIRRDVNLLRGYTEKDSTNK